ncbi:MAG: FAD-dependent oxidoreductase [Deltaproteobacteria bacterium]|nr:FAD-dependent oxidoreductase [Deltaproteobacteria bacterium]
MPEEKTEIVIVGLGAGGLYASKSALIHNKQCRISILERRDHDQFSPCGLPFVLEGVVDSFEDLKYVVPEVRDRLVKYLRHNVVGVDKYKKIVTAVNLETGEEREFPYDALILSHGASPVNLPIPGAKELVGKGVHFCSNIDDTCALRDAALGSKKKSAVVVGGGAVGLEVAVALRMRGLEVAVTKRTPPPFPRDLDPEMGKFVIAELERLGIRVLFGKGIDSIGGSDRVESVTIDGEEIPCDIAVMAVGMRGNTQLAEMVGAAINNHMVVTNDRMETTVEGVYAIGDLAQSYSRIDRTPATMQLATSAFRQGMTAGVNAAGGNVEYPGVLNTFLTGIGKLEIAATGYSLKTAKALGYNAKAIGTKREIKPHYIPNITDVNLRIIAEIGSGKVLGAQAIGEEGAAWRINVVALAIHGGMTLNDLLDAELSYFPGVSQMYDPLTQLVEIGMKRLKLKQREAVAVVDAKDREVESYASANATDSGPVPFFLSSLTSSPISTSAAPAPSSVPNTEPITPGKPTWTMTLGLLSGLPERSSWTVVVPTMMPRLGLSVRASLTGSSTAIENSQKAVAGAWIASQLLQ